MRKAAFHALYNVSRNNSFTIQPIVPFRWLILAVKLLHWRCNYSSTYSEQRYRNNKIFEEENF